jgi:hypothetical protein
MAYIIAVNVSPYNLYSGPCSKYHRHLFLLKAGQLAFALTRLIRRVPMTLRTILV